MTVLENSGGRIVARSGVVRPLIQLLLVLLAATAFGQDASQWDATGNALLSGSHYFRQVAFVTGSPAGEISRAVAAYGAIDFDGAGAYEIDGFLLDSNSPGGPQPYTLSGSYRIAASGYGLLSNPLVEGEAVYGLVANGVFVGSATDSGVNDLFVAGLSEPGGPEALQGGYRLASVEFPDLDAAEARAALMTLQADGAGGFAAGATAVGYAANGAVEQTQSLGGASYTLANGAGTLTLPDGVLAGGEKVLYRAAGGAVIFGGSPDGWDLFVGICSADGEPAFDGLYFQAGLTHDFSQSGAGQTVLDSYYGALNANSGHILGHQRIKRADEAAAFDYTYADQFEFAGDGTYDGLGGLERFVVGKDGETRLGFLNAPYMGFSLALEAPAVDGGGVFLHPAGVVNAASFAPFTAGLAPGEMVSLFGSGLSPGTTAAAALPLPVSLDGVQVLFDGQPAPLVFASPGQISAIVPYATAGPIVRVQVVNNGEASNETTNFVNIGMPGVFSAATSGAGAAAALHPDFTLVTEQHPVLPGGSVAFFVTGLGHVTPPVADGAAGPAGPLSVAADGISAAIGGQDALVAFAGLAPGFAGLYQVNVIIPAGAPPGPASVDIIGSDSFTSQTTVAIGGGAALRETGDRRLRPRRPRKSVTGGFPAAPQFRWDSERTLR